MLLQRVEEIEKKMDELEIELEELNSNPDKEFVKKRSNEIIEESHKLSEEMFEIVSKISGSLGIDLSDIDSEEECDISEEEK